MRPFDPIYFPVHLCQSFDGVQKHGKVQVQHNDPAICILTRDRIKCNSCEKNLLAVRFSETMKKKYMDSLSRHQRNSRVGIKYPRCVECAGGNIQELKCVMCDATKSLDHFARTQRRKPDDAVGWLEHHTLASRQTDRRPALQRLLPREGRSRAQPRRRGRGSGHHPGDGGIRGIAHDPWWRWLDLTDSVAGRIFVTHLVRHERPTVTTQFKSSSIRDRHQSRLRHIRRQRRSVLTQHQTRRVVRQWLRAVGSELAQRPR